MKVLIAGSLVVLGLLVPTTAFAATESTMTANSISNTPAFINGYINQFLNKSTKGTENKKTISLSAIETEIKSIETSDSATLQQEIESSSSGSTLSSDFTGSITLESKSGKAEITYHGVSKGINNATVTESIAGSIIDAHGNKYTFTGTYSGHVASELSLVTLS